MLRIKNIKITPEQLDEIETHLQRASWVLNSEEVPNWEDLNQACREISDALQDLKIIRENADRETRTSDWNNAPYLKPELNRKPEKIGNIRI